MQFLRWLLEEQHSWALCAAQTDMCGPQHEQYYNDAQGTWTAALAILWDCPFQVRLSHVVIGGTRNADLGTSNPAGLLVTG